MSSSRRLETGARLALVAVTALTSAYALLCYIPFTWKQFISFHFYPAWFGFFLDFHRLFFWAALAPVLWALAWGNAVSGGGPLARRRLCLGLMLAAGALLTAEPLSRLENGAWALRLSMLAWAPLLLWESFLAAERLPELSWRMEPAGQDRRRLFSAFACALYLFSAYSASYLFRLQPPYSWAATGLALAWSLIAHGLAFIGFCAALDALRSLSELSGSPGRTECGLAFLAFALGLYFIIDKLVLAAFTFYGLRAAATALLWSSGLAAAAAGQALSWHAGGRPVPDSVEFLAAGPRLALGPLIRARAGRAAFLLFVFVVPAVAHSLISRQDWNGLIETLSALLVWSGCFVFFHGVFKAKPNPAPRPRPWAILAAFLVFAWAADATMLAAQHPLRLLGVDVRRELRRLSEGDPSYRLARRLFATAPSGSGFYQFLQANTNLSRETPIKPADIRLTQAFGPGLKKKPNIFLFVVDSLRQDYVGAYNPKVRFTPSFDGFAAESLLWKRAFTAYGATGLSQPSIWSGSLLIHKQYVTPFHPMNSLEKLLDHENYRRFITVDPVLTQLLEPSPSLEPLDAHTVGTYRLCDTLAELTSKLRTLGPGAPFFVYTQPQDIHISVINRAGNDNLTKKEYPGFYAPYASRVETIDRCFGVFIAKLKKENLFEDSIIILTADHGDALGEGDRWGHAYTLFPEILRVPLIMHVPERLLRGRYKDLDAPAFLIDIAPTLYSLLGHGPPDVNPLFGRALLPAGRQEFEASEKAEQFLASSYGPVYGLLRERGRYLYIVDAINYKNHYYDLSRDPGGRTNLVDAQIVEQANKAIRRQIEAINRFYGYEP